MGNSKVIFGNETLIDLTGDTVTPDTLLAGTTAHNRSGNQIVGTATVPDTLDDLTDVELTSPAAGDLLQRNGNGEWVNSAAVPNALAAVRDNGAVNKAGAVTIQTQAVSGLTITRNSDDTVTISGVYGGANRLDLDYVDRYTFALGAGTYRLTGCPSGYSNVELIMQVDGRWAKTGQTDYGNGCTFTATTSVNALAIRIQPGADFSTPATFKPMISDAALNLSYADYQPYSMTNRELTEAVTGNTFGTFVDATSLLPYTIPSDGYITAGAKGSSSYMYARIKDANNVDGPECYAIGAGTDTWVQSSVFVRKGMIVYSTGNSGTGRVRFYPINN